MAAKNLDQLAGIVKNKIVRVLCALFGCSVHFRVDRREFNLQKEGVYELYRPRGGERTRRRLDWVEAVDWYNRAQWVRVVPQGYQIVDVKPMKRVEFEAEIVGLVGMQDSWEELGQRVSKNVILKARLQTSDGYEVVVPNGLELTAAQQRFLCESICEMEIGEVVVDSVAFEFDSERRNFGRTVNVSTVVGDTVVYGAVGYTTNHETGGLCPIWGRFVSGRKCEWSSWLTVILRRCGSVWEVRTVFIGRKGEPWPGDPNGDYSKSVQYWQDRALIWGTYPVRIDRLGKPITQDDCPW